jgi:nucleobase:cation symporter-1, NCS1 family
VLTVVYMALAAGHIHWSTVSSLPAGSAQKVIGALVFLMTGFGLGWVNAAADYSRYLPRRSSSAGVVGWTTFGGAVAPVVLLVFGLLLAGSSQDLSKAIAADPIGALVGTLPTWFLVPFVIVAVLGLVGGAVLDIYSSGLNLLSLGVRLPRYQSVAIDGTLMIIGNIYILFFANDFFAPFQGFLITLGVLLASWSAVFLTDLWMYRVRRGYDANALYDPRSSYGAWNPAGVAAFLTASVIGLGLVTSTSPVFEHWVGYLLGPFGGKGGAVGASSIGLLIAFVVGGVLYAVFSVLLGRTRARQPVAAAS